LVKNGVSVPQKIITGQRLTARIEIIEGLKVGDSLITVGVQVLKPEGKVTAVGNS
jgi:hypothetical protein